MKNKINKIIKALGILKQAFDANVTAHMYAEKSQQSYWYGDHGDAKTLSFFKEESYEEKAKYIDLAIKYIQKNSLPIKYGIGKEIEMIYNAECTKYIYYFSFAGKQISFHGFGKKLTEEKIKEYNGKWSGRKNNDICPFNKIIYSFIRSKDKNKYEKFANKYLHFSK